MNLKDLFGPAPGINGFPDYSLRICTACRKKFLKSAIECPHCGEEVRENSHLREPQVSPTIQEPALFRAEGANGVVEVFDEKIRVMRKGAMSLFTHGLQGEKDILDLSSLFYPAKKGWQFNEGVYPVRFHGVTEAKSGIGQATRDENTVMFDQWQQPAFETLRQMLDEKIRNTASVNEATPNLDQLEKLASLRDKGIVTDEEFAAKKRQLLELE